MPEVSIIILTFNSANFIEPLLNSIKDFAHESEIVMVDNSSSDETIKIAKTFENLKIFETGENLGFAKGINFGAEKSKGKYLLFMNPDTNFEKGKMADMIKIFDENEKIGVVGGKLVTSEGKSEKSAGNFFNLFETLLIILGLDEKFGVRFSPEKPTKVDFISGGFMMVESNLFKKLGGFDENFFMYVEDMEFCYRVKKEGLETYFTPEVVISHKGQGSSNRAFAVINIYKGIIYFYRKHKSKTLYFIVKTALSLKAIAVYLIGVLTNNNYYKTTYKKAFFAINK